MPFDRPDAKSFTAFENFTVNVIVKVITELLIILLLKRNIQLEKVQAIMDFFAITFL